MRRANLRNLRSVHPLVACAFLAVFYLLLSAVLPANTASTQQYGWTSSEYHVFYLMIFIPMVATWFAAFYGYHWVQLYARSIKGTPEGESYSHLAKGVLWLALSLPVPSIASLILNTIANQNHGFISVAVVLTNYLTLLLPLFGFMMIGTAARQLTNTSALRLSFSGARSVVFLFVLLGVGFCYLVLKHLDLSNPGSIDNPYYLPLWATLITVIVPYLYAWFVGLLAAYEFSAVAAKTRGVLFSQALRLFALGLVIVIACSIGLQYINSAAPRSGHLELNGRLLASYLFRIAAGIGFLVIANGARKLQKIEEV